MYFFFFGWELLRYKFSGPNLVSPLTKIPIQAHKLLWAPTNISNILPKYFSHITQIFPHVITQLGPSQILPNISHILLPNLGSHKYFPYKPHKLFWYQNWATKLCHLYKSPNSFTLWAKPKKSNKTLLQNPLLLGISKAHYYMAP